MNARRQVIILLALGLMTACSTGNTPEPPAPSWSPPPTPNPPKVDGPGDTAILVLDHFRPPAKDQPHDSKRSPGERLPNCTYVGTATNEVGSGGGGSGLPAGVSHGQAVFETVDDDLKSRGLIPAAPPAITHPLVVSGFVKAWKFNDKTMLLVGVHIQDYDTALLADQLGKVLDEIKRQTNITRFVLNMSFVVAPCDIKAWFDEAGPNLTTTSLLDSYRAVINGVESLNDLRLTLESFVTANPGLSVDKLLSETTLARARDAALVNLFHERLDQEVRQIDRWPPTTPGLLQVIQEPLRLGIHTFLQPNGYQVIPVGASGNGIWLPGPKRYRPDFPFAPALWNVVVSVGATDLDRETRAEYSNGAEVMMNPLNRYKAKGTSFAAPHLAAMEALYLMGGGQVVCDRHIPPLGYTDIDVVGPRPVWRNLWLSAVPRNGDPALTECTVFKQNIPPSP